MKADLPSIQISGVVKKKDSAVPKEKEDNTSFENSVERIEDKRTSLEEAVSSIVLFVKSSQEALHPPQVISKKIEVAEIEREEKMDLVPIPKENKVYKSPSLEAATSVVLPVPVVLENPNVPIKERPLDDLQTRANSRVNPQPKAASIALESVDPSVPAEKATKKCLVDAVEVKSRVSQASTSSTVRQEANQITEVVSKEDSFLQRFIINRVDPQSKVAAIALESAEASVPKEKEICLVGSVELRSPVPQASTISTVIRIKATPSIPVSGVVTKEDSLLQRFIECRENLSSAKKSIIDNQATTQNHLAKKDYILFTTLIYPVKKNHLFAIEGHRGKGLNRICKDYDVKIKIHKEQEKVSIIGKKERCGDALIAIKGIVSRQEKLVANLDSDLNVQV